MMMIRIVVLLLVLLGGGSGGGGSCGGCGCAGLLVSTTTRTARRTATTRRRIKRSSTVTTTVTTTATSSTSGSSWLVGSTRRQRRGQKLMAAFFTSSTSLFASSTETSTETPTETTSSSSEQQDNNDDDDDKTKNNIRFVPVTFLSGFLGTGKTTLLKNLLEQQQQSESESESSVDRNRPLRVGVIVNDVASVNIDSKLISSSTNIVTPTSSNTNTAMEMIELQNGCVCCSLADELYDGIENLLSRGTQNEISNTDSDSHAPPPPPPLDAIVVELSGVSDPTSIKNRWMIEMPTSTDGQVVGKLNQIITLVDSTTFGTDYLSGDDAMDRKGWMNNDNDMMTMSNDGNRKVSELLVEQVEAADTILVNKIDLATKEQAYIASNVARALNENAMIETVSYGQINDISEMKSMLLLKQQQQEQQQQNKQVENHNNHNHNEHSHSHDHHEQNSSHCSSSLSSSCHDPTCTDPSHDHEHTHEHSSSSSSSGSSGSGSLSTDGLGISSFVYKRDKPFHPMRIMEVLNQWPIPIKDTLDMKFFHDNDQEEDGEHGTESSNEEDDDDVYYDDIDDQSPFRGVLRSKGFCWFAPNSWNSDAWRHDTAMYWSMSGKCFSITAAGRWWHTIPRTMMKDIFQQQDDGAGTGGTRSAGSSGIKEYERIIREDFVTEQYGDRRQELVFIGIDLDQELITKTLDNCLYTAEDMKIYEQQLESQLNQQSPQY